MRMNMETLDKLYIEISNVSNARNRRELSSARLIDEAYTFFLKYCNREEEWREFDEPIMKLKLAHDILTKKLEI